MTGITTKDSLLAEVATYYALKLAEHGKNPRGVDWNGEESQLLRFEQLCKIIGASNNFTLTRPYQDRRKMRDWRWRPDAC